MQSPGERIIDEPPPGGENVKLYWRVKINGKWTWRPVEVMNRERRNNRTVLYEVEEWEEHGR